MSSGRPKVRMGAVYRFGALCIAYYVTGWIAQKSIFPPDYAVAVWPGAGVALAGLLVFGARYWPAILLAGFALNLNMPFDTSAVAVSIAFCLAMSFGAVLQALLGLWLIRRFSRFPHQVDRYQDLVAMIALGGPVACLVSALAGPALLGFQDAIPWSAYWQNAALWWVGDTLGVLLVLPTVSAWASELRGAPLRTRVAVAVPPVLLIAMTFGIYVGLNASECRSIRDTFAAHAVSMRLALEQHLHRHVRIVESTAGFLSRHPALSESEFRAFAQEILDHHAGLQALEWIPRVPHDAREALESRAHANGHPGFQITQYQPDAPPEKSADRAVYFPVYYLAPPEGNESAYGFDLASHPERRATLQKAAATGKVSATGPITLVQERAGQAGVLLVMPVYAGQNTASEAETLDSVLGFALGVFRVGDFLAEVLNPYDLSNVRLQLADIEGTGAAEKLAAFGRAGAAFPDGAMPESGIGQLQWEAEFPVAGRTWRLSLAPSPEAVAELRTYQPETVLISGLLVTTLLGTVLLVLAGRNAVTEHLVAQRTEELHREVEERRRIQQEREALIEDLERALKEIRTLHGLLPICASCKKIRDDAGSWTPIETYLSAHAEVDFSHGICPDCAIRLYPDYRSSIEKPH